VSPAIRATADGVMARAAANWPLALGAGLLGAYVPLSTVLRLVGLAVSFTALVMQTRLPASALAKSSRKPAAPTPAESTAPAVAGPSVRHQEPAPVRRRPAAPRGKASGRRQKAGTR
jgi:hypothetical protein